MRKSYHVRVTAKKGCERNAKSEVRLLSVAGLELLFLAPEWVQLIIVGAFGGVVLGWILVAAQRVMQEYTCVVINVLLKTVDLLIGAKGQVITDFPIAPKEYIEQLEHYLASDSEDASTYQFFTEVGAIEKLSPNEVEKNVVDLAKKLERYAELIAEVKRELDIADKINEKSEETHKEIYQKTFQSTVVLYELLNEIAEKYWNYLPCDFQDGIEESAYSILKKEFFMVNSSRGTPLEKDCDKILGLAYSLLDHIEKSSLKLANSYSESDLLLPNPKESLQQSLQDLANGKTFPISELWDSDNE